MNRRIAANSRRRSCTHEPALLNHNDVPAQFDRRQLRLPPMNRTGLVIMTGMMVGLPLTTVSCRNGSSEAEQTLPPIATTTTSTIATTTTTIYVIVTYEIKSGDGLRGIAEQHGVDIDDQAAANGIVDYNDIEAGEVLTIPAATVPTTLPPDTTTATTIALAPSTT